MTVYKSKALSSIFVTLDGLIMSLKFKTAKGGDVEIELPAVQIRPIIQQIMGAVSDAEARSDLSKQGVVAVLTPLQTTVRAESDGQHVFVAFQMEGNLEYKFALPATEALRLAREIAGAAQSGTKSPAARSH